MGGGNSKNKNNRPNGQMQSSHPQSQDAEDFYDDGMNDQLIQGYS
jgi:hypothetical protein